jgi:ATP-dependent DNA helicase PIF1
LQLPPPSKDSKFIFESVFWSELKNLKMMQLETVFRQTDPQFITILNELRMGSISSASIDVLKKLDRPQEINDNCKPTKL